MLLKLISCSCSYNANDTSRRLHRAAPRTGSQFIYTPPVWKDTWVPPFLICRQMLANF